MSEFSDEIKNAPENSRIDGANYTLVTDSGADRELLKKWRSTGTKIIITDTRQTS